MEELKIEYLPLAALTPYEKNTRKHQEFDVGQIAESIQQFGFDDPIGVWGPKNIIVEGHGRLLAAKKLGMKKVPCIHLDHLTDEQRREYAIAHNKTAELSEWDFDLLQLELEDLDMSAFDFEFDFDFAEPDPEEKEKRENTSEKGSLVKRFGAPPFTVLDTRQGYWQDRKTEWKNIGLKSQKGRKEHLLGEGLAAMTNEFLGGCEALQGISIFDPVLTELMYRWFCPDGGKIYDCFAGGSVRGVVAEKLGYHYTGIDLRPEQIAEDKKQAEQIGVFPRWFCDDSQNADKYVEDGSCDMIFSCPPYADLEVYSDDPRDISNMEYEDFCRVYKNIIEIACRKLKENRFAVFVVGDVRDKKGFYRNFVDYTKKCFNENGCMTYNEFILVEAIGTGAIRANKTFGSLRKAVKTHQNVLCFYKGVPKKIKEEFGEVQIPKEFMETDSEMVLWITLFLFKQQQEIESGGD